MSAWEWDVEPFSESAHKEDLRNEALHEPEVLARARAVERGEEPSGSVVMKVTGPNSLATPGGEPEVVDAELVEEEPAGEPSGTLPQAAPEPRPTVLAQAKALAQRVSEAMAAEYRQATDERDARLGGAPPVTADVAPLVRQLVEAGEELDAVAALFAGLAAQAREYVTNEALAVGTDRLVVPDGETEIVVAPDVKRKTWVEAEGIRDVVAARAAAAFGGRLEESGLVGGVVRDLEAAYLDGAKTGFDEVLRLAAPSWRTTALGGLRQDLMAAHDDDAAAAVERSYGKREEVGESLTVKREALKRGRRMPS